MHIYAVVLVLIRPFSSTLPTHLTRSLFFSRPVTLCLRCRAQSAELQLENQRLRAVVAAMRQDLESAAAGAAAGAPHPPAASVLAPDLAGLEHELSAALQYIHVLQSADPAAGTELQFLRGRVRELQSENLKLRRDLSQLTQQQQQSFHNPSSSAGHMAAPPSTSEFEAMRRECDRLRMEFSNGMAAAAASPDASVRAAVNRLQRDVDMAREEARRLKRENDRLMDLSNELRGELDRQHLLRELEVPNAVGASSRSTAAAARVRSPGHGPARDRERGAGNPRPREASLSGASEAAAASASPSEDEFALGGGGEGRAAGLRGPRSGNARVAAAVTTTTTNSGFVRGSGSGHGPGQAGSGGGDPELPPDRPLTSLDEASALTTRPALLSTFGASARETTSQVRILRG